MKRILSLFAALAVILSFCGCSKKLSDIVSDIEKLMPAGEEVVEVKYEEFSLHNPQFSSCYNELNGRQKDYYSRIYAISEEMTQGYIDLGKFYEGAVNDVSVAYSAFLYDNAEIFWMPNTYILATSESGGTKKLAIAFSCSDGDRQNEYAVGRANRDAYRTELNNAVNEVMAVVNTLGSEYEKEKYINDYICDNVSYDENARLNNTAYGALVLKSTLCEGYARGFKLLCNEAGIECDLIVGESQNVGHMWNRVNIDRIHSYVDVTWNDRSEYKSYAYFNLTDEQIRKTHDFAPILDDLTADDLADRVSFNFTERECSFTGNTYYEQSGRILWLDYGESAAKLIEQSAAAGESYTEFMFATDSAQQLFENDPVEYLKKIQEYLSSVTISGYSQERDVLILLFE